MLSDPGALGMDIADLRISIFDWLRAFFGHAQLKIYKPRFTFRKSISICQKSS